MKDIPTYNEIEANIWNALFEVDRGKIEFEHKEVYSAQKVFHLEPGDIMIKKTGRYSIEQIMSRNRQSRPSLPVEFYGGQMTVSFIPGSIYHKDPSVSRFVAYPYADKRPLLKDIEPEKLCEKLALQCNGFFTKYRMVQDSGDSLKLRHNFLISPTADPDKARRKALRTFGNKHNFERRKIVNQIRGILEANTTGMEKSVKMALYYTSIVLSASLIERGTPEQVFERIRKIDPLKKGKK